MAPNFTACGNEFTNQYEAGNRTLAYNGSIRGVLKGTDRLALITVEGCLELCGHGYELYDSSVWTNTVTTWVLPVVGGLLLQAPFESNRFWRTFFALMRWLGSPIGSMSYVFWNIKVLGKCALMVDMAVGYSRLPPERIEETAQTPTPGSTLSAPPPVIRQSGFARLRDSFYLLSVMNQFNIPPILPNMSAEKLLRIALFSDTLELSTDLQSRSLPQRREDLAKELRSRRRRGTVPVFISVGWFFVSLAISINTAFGELGANSTAHNLALGLMLGWLPVFILACIVDRNPLSTNEVRKSLNQYLDVVRSSLIADDSQMTYVEHADRATGHQQLIEDLIGHEKVFESFFRDFAGQGRTKWHYGVAHSVLAAVEDVGAAKIGRDWFELLEGRHDSLVLGPERPIGLHYFDWHESWQIVEAILIVFGTLLGAFVISVFTPTVGLGCRSGGYMIYFLLTTTSFALEMVVWAKVSGQYKGREARHISTLPGIAPLRRMTASTIHLTQPWLGPFLELPVQEKLDRAVFKPFDIINTGWLVYIVCSQTFGLYDTCQCIGSTWGLGFHGGYIDFLSVVTYKAKGISAYWAAGTGISIAFLAIPSIYIFAEWLSQSHLSTENYRRAMRGLARTRTWKRYTPFLRFKLTRPGATRSLVWSAHPRQRRDLDSEEVPLTRYQT